MPIDAHANRFLQMLNAGKGQPPRDLEVDDRRSALEELMRLAGPKTAVARVDDRIIPNSVSPLHLRIYTPLGAGSGLLPGMVYFHGGGFVAGTLATHDGIARELARAGACRVVSVDYRLAPEHPFPAAVDDARSAASFIAAHADEFGIDESRLGICGDSAGGTLAAATCQSFARAGGPALALQLLLCPILDYHRSTESRREFAQGYLVDQATLDHELRQYLPSATDTADPRISPLCARDVSGLPRTVIHTAEFDPLRDEGKLYFERLTGAGTVTSYTCHPGMIHLFYGLGAIIPYAHAAYLQIGSDIRAALG